MLRLAERGEESRGNRELSLAPMAKDIPGFEKSFPAGTGNGDLLPAAGKGYRNRGA
ncbi:MAG TPA: hypothetical protein PL043_03220 [Methanolinea sp.]|nr:hypothetical protein [Methanolinea sp.]